MKFSELTDLLFTMWASGSQQAVMLLGKPGIGKTAVGRALAARITEHERKLDANAPEAGCWVKDLSSSLPEDINGLPRVNGAVMSFCPDEWLHDACKSGRKGVLILDDLPAASTAVQVACRQLVLDRKAHEHRLSPGVMVIVTGNRREDKSAATTLPAHFRNAVLHLHLDSEVKEWIIWRGQQENREGNIIPSFLVWRSNKFAMLPADADANGVFATPRTWDMLDRHLAVAQRCDALHEVAAGFVGEGVAAEFVGFMRVHASLVDPRKVLNNPQQAIPDPSVYRNDDKLGELIAMLGALVGVAFEHPKGAGRDDIEKLVRAVAWVTQGNQELVVHAMTLASGSRPLGGREFALTAARIKSDPLVGKMIAGITRALGGDQ